MTEPTETLIDFGDLTTVENTTKALIDLAPPAVEDVTAPAASTAIVPAGSNTAIDVTLLRGLEPAMLEEEQARLTALLTSGDPNDLAVASKVFYDFTSMLSAGIYTPGERKDVHHFRLKESFLSKVNTNRPGFNDRDERVADEKKVNDVVRQERAHALPLPVRTPRYVVMDPFDANDSENKKCPLNFLDDPWDGTLGGAFTKLDVHRDDKGKGFIKKMLPGKLRLKDKQNSHVDHDLQFAPGYDEIVDRMPGGYSARLVPDVLLGETQPRVLIAGVKGPVAKLGLLQRGDVVTHVNGEEFTGTAKELKELISAHYHAANAEDSETAPAQLELVVNAELCIAQALKLRSTI